MRTFTLAPLASAVWNVILLCLSVWFTFRTLRSVTEKYLRIGNKRRVSVTSPQSKSKETVRITLILTGTTSVFLTLGQLTNLVWLSLIIEGVERTGETNVFKISRNQPRFVVINILYSFAFIGGYIGLLLTCFLRLIQTFGRTQQYRLTEAQIRRGYATIAFLVITHVSMMICFYTLDRWVPILMMVFILLIYSLCSLWISYSFFDKTLRLSQTLSFGQHTQSEDSLSDNDINDNGISSGSVSPASNENNNGTNKPGVWACNQSTGLKRRKLSAKATQLMSVSLRLSILANISILSALIGVGSMISVGSAQGSALFFVGMIVHNTDYCINCFCLMCFFDASLTHYRWVFGRIHDYFWSQLGFEYGE